MRGPCPHRTPSTRTHRRNNAGDGVIADTEPDGHRPAFNAAFKEKGFSDVWTKEHYGELLETGGGKERMTAHWNEVGWPAGYDSAEKQQEAMRGLEDAGGRWSRQCR